MNFFVRSPHNCAKALHFLIGIYIVWLITFAFLPILHLPVIVLLVFFAGAALYQTGFPVVVAGVLSLALLLPYAGGIFFFIMLVWIRWHLQNQNYIVGVFGAWENSQAPVDVPAFSWRTYSGWGALFIGPPFLLFFFLWMFNPPYMLKFIQPFEHHWFIGPAILGAAVMVDLFTFAFGIEFYRLRYIRPPSSGRTLQLIGLCLLAVLFSTIASLIIVLAPAALTMLELQHPAH